MPVVEADFLKAIIDPQDHLHNASVNVLKKIQEQKWVVSSSALLELDLLLKQSEVSFSERFEVFEALKIELQADRIVSLSPAVVSQAIQLQNKYHEIQDFYFDSIHLATAILHDGVIVSSDTAFDQIAEVKRMPLSKVR